MGILDFTEICSPKLSKEVSLESGISALSDDFELFCQEFFGVVKRMRIFDCVSRGSDGGIDLGVEEVSQNGTKTKWLVSCKHKASSGSSVSEAEEKNIIERVCAWDCDGFIPFYTTIPSVKVDTLINGVERFGKRVERYTKERIERELLENSAGVKLAARYFPRSMVNHYGKIVETISEFSVNDVMVIDGIAKVGGFSQYIGNASEGMSNYIKSQLVLDANLKATMALHKPYFFSALLDAVGFAPEFFKIEKMPTKLEEFKYVVPVWEPYLLYRASVTKGLSFSYFIAAVWSFWDWSSANTMLAQCLAFRSEPLGDRELNPEEVEKLVNSEEFFYVTEAKKAAGLLAPGLVGLKLQEKTRDIVTRLFAFANPIPYPA